MHGLADATGIEYKTVLQMHMLPELIKASCSMMGAWGGALTDTTGLLQVRTFVIMVMRNACMVSGSHTDSVWACALRCTQPICVMLGRVRLCLVKFDPKGIVGALNSHGPRRLEVVRMQLDEHMFKYRDVVRTGPGPQFSTSDRISVSVAWYALMGYTRIQCKATIR